MPVPLHDNHAALARVCAVESMTAYVFLCCCADRGQSVAVAVSPPRHCAGTDLVVVCVKWGTKYDAAYVNRLHRAVARWLSTPHAFVCFTDDATAVDHEV